MRLPESIHNYGFDRFSDTLYATCHIRMSTEDVTTLFNGDMTAVYLVLHDNEKAWMLVRHHRLGAKTELAKDGKHE